jgi:hypothetical protein
LWGYFFPDHRSDPSELVGFTYRHTINGLTLQVSSTADYFKISNLETIAPENHESGDAKAEDTINEMVI